MGTWDEIRSKAAVATEELIREGRPPSAPHPGPAPAKTIAAPSKTPSPTPMESTRTPPPAARLAPPVPVPAPAEGPDTFVGLGGPTVPVPDAALAVLAARRRTPAPRKAAAPLTPPASAPGVKPVAAPSPAPLAAGKSPMETDSPASLDGAAHLELDDLLSDVSTAGDDDLGGSDGSDPLDEDDIGRGAAGAAAGAAAGGDDAFGGWDPDDIDTFWLRVHAIEAAGDRGDEALHTALEEVGLRDKAHFDEVRESFNRRHGDDPAFMQAAIDARTKGIKQQMLGRMQGELKGELAPFEGVSLEQWAWLMAKVAGGGDVAELLSLAKLDEGKWDRVSAEWNARMSRDTTATIATAYGQAFVATGPGPFGEAAEATAAAMLDPDKKGVDGKEPISMERWIEITEAQSAAAKRGLEASAVLSSYGMTPADWGVAGGWWSQHFTANAMKLMPEYNRLQQKYKAKFAEGVSADESDS